MAQLKAIVTIAGYKPIADRRLMAKLTTVTLAGYQTITDRRLMAQLSSTVTLADYHTIADRHLMAQLICCNISRLPHHHR